MSPPPSRSGSGDREAILALVPTLRTYARGLTGGNEHAADDLVQDTLVLALQPERSDRVSQTTRPAAHDPSRAAPSPTDPGPRAASRGDIRAVIPALRVAARDLAAGSPLRADELVRDTIVRALRDWARRPADADLGAWLTGLLADRSRAGGDPA